MVKNKLRKFAENLTFPNLFQPSGGFATSGRHPINKPNEKSILFPKYLKIILKYKELYKLCSEKKCMLLGVIKDSRGKRMVNCLDKKLNTSDSIFLNYVLKERERTIAIPLSDSVEKHTILKDLKEWSNVLGLFYIKSVKNDYPIRIEFLKTKENDIDKIASLIYTLSAINSRYAYPSVLIEVDLRAMLNPIELDRIKRKLNILYPTGAFSVLRRNSRPFR